jgi:hypothetical protein
MEGEKPSYYYFDKPKVEFCVTTNNLFFLPSYAQASMWTVDHFKHQCHIRLLGSTNLVDLMTSGIGKYTLCVLHTPVVMPLNPAKAPWTCKVWGSWSSGTENRWSCHEVDWQQGETVAYSVLTKHRASDGIRCIGTNSAGHVCRINVLDIRMDSYVLEMRLDLWYGILFKLIMNVIGTSIKVNISV